VTAVVRASDVILALEPDSLSSVGGF